MIGVPDFPNEYVIQDENGQILRLDLDKKTTVKIFSYHSGSIVSSDTSPLLHTMASLGSDGSLRLYEYASKKCVNVTTFSTPGSFLCYLPEVIFLRYLMYRNLIAKELI